MEWRRREGLQCPFCLYYSSHRAPTCEKHEDYITDDLYEEVQTVCQQFNSHNKILDRDEANYVLESLFFDITARDLLGSRVIIGFYPNDEEKQQFIEEYGVYWEGDYGAIAREYDSVERKFHIYWEYDNEYAGEMTAIELYNYSDTNSAIKILDYLEQFP